MTDKETMETKLLILDCDGVLTNGQIVYDSNLIESKQFCVKDGLGIKAFQMNGGIVVVITGRRSGLLEQRCRDLGIEHLYQGVWNKLHFAEALVEKLGLDWAQTAYMGDDWNDWPVMEKAGITAAPADAFPDLKKRVDFVSQRNGGQGAVRDFIEYLLKTQGRYEAAIQGFLAFCRQSAR